MGTHTLNPNHHCNGKSRLQDHTYFTVWTMERKLFNSSLSERCREALVHRRIFVELTDGRTMCGQFTCVDKEGNIILSNASEGQPETTYVVDGKRVESKARTRNVGTVLIPRDLRASCHAELDLEHAVDLKLDVR